MSKRALAVLCAIGGIAIGICIAGTYPYWKPSPSATASNSSTPADAAAFVEPAAPVAKYQNVSFVDESFALPPGGFKAYSLRAVRNRVPFQIVWHSSGPTHIAVLRSDLVKLAAPGDGPRLFSISECQQESVTNSHYNCQLRSNDVGVEMILLVLDSRYGQHLGIGDRLFGSRQALDQASVQNDATLQILQRRCVSNCDGSDAAYP